MSRRRNPIATALTVYALTMAALALTALAAVTIRLVPLLLVAGCIGWGWYRVRHLPNGASIAPDAGAIRDLDLSPEVARLKGEVTRLLAVNDQLQCERDEAIESAHAAWDAASDGPPRPTRPADPSRNRLLKAPRSGVRPLSGTWEDR